MVVRNRIYFELKKKKKTFEYIFFALFIITFLLIPSTYLIQQINTENVTTTVIKTDVKRIDGNDVFMVFCEKETFIIKDSLFHSQFESADIYAKITPGKYRFTVCGYRIPIISRFRNIISYDEL